MGADQSRVKSRAARRVGAGDAGDYLASVEHGDVFALAGAADIVRALELAFRDRPIVDVAFHGWQIVRQETRFAGDAHRLGGRDGYRAVGGDEVLVNAVEHREAGDQVWELCFDFGRDYIPRGELQIARGAGAQVRGGEFEGGRLAGRANVVNHLRAPGSKPRRLEAGDVSGRRVDIDD